MSTSQKPKSYLPKIILAVVLLIGGYFGYKKYHYATSHEDTDNAQIEAYFIPVLPRMAGFVKKVYVNDYDQVKKGQLIVEIDSDEAALALEEMQVEVEQAQADIESARANVTNLKKSIEAQQSLVKSAELANNKYTRDVARNAALESAKAITRQQLIDSQDLAEQGAVKYQGAKAELSSTQSKIGILQATLHKAEIALKLKKVKVQQQKLKLSYNKVYAPADGKIGKKSVEPGQFIQVSQPLMTIMDDSRYWVVANYKETQVESLKVGMSTEIKIDAYPEITLTGRILSISESTGAKTTLLPPDNASGNFVKVTQRIPVKIEILNADKYKDILRAGLSLDVSVPIN
ncbi:HlyD family secretion protein [Aquirufa ecclesiirivi]|uniref:HlyD family secretion protein n=1 Tax=Aquirufa ecclesiirivi TaxID=2715124 RepID=UPI0022A863CB|nr:HlyD family secretion protein [Aquirufa ecclesiirivi]MCZ2472297.1 HlyD family secretion protein [Aquirufa ecclesiirivi]